MLTTIDIDADVSPRVISEDDRVIALATKASQGDEGAFTELYGILSQRVFNLVLRSVRDRGTAEDLCQEIWLKVHKEVGSLRSPDAFRSWVFRIASRACIDFARSPRAAHACTEELADELAHSREPQPEDAVIRDSEVRMVWESLATMAPRQGIALYLKQVDGRSYEEIASILDCSRETVESLLFRARQSFVRAYNRVLSSPVERCVLFQQVVAGVIDDEPTQLQKSAIKAHLQDCRACRTQLPEIAAAAKRYSLLPLLPANAVAWQAIIGGSAVGGAILAPAATGGIVASLSLKTKLAGLISILVLGAGGAATTGIVDVPLVPDSAGIFDRGPSHQDQAGLNTAGVSGSGNREQAPDGGTNPAPPSTNTGGPGHESVDHRETGSHSGDSPTSPGTQPVALPPAALPTGVLNGTAPDPGDPIPEEPLGTLLNDPIGSLDGLAGGALGSTLGTLDGTLEGVGEAVESLAGTVDRTLGQLGETVGDLTEPLDGTTGGVPDDALDALLPPDDGDSGPVGDLVEGLDDALPGEQDQGGGLLGDVLDPLQPPSATQPPDSSTAAPEATAPPQPCLLVILC